MRIHDGVNHSGGPLYCSGCAHNGGGPSSGQVEELLERELSVPVSNKSRQKRQGGQRPIGRNRGLTYSAALAALGLSVSGHVIPQV
jgi:hypothetical protein